MKRSAQIAAAALLVVLLGHPLAAVCACWQRQAGPASPTSGCHENTAPGTSVQSTARDCCLVVPAAPAPPQPSAQNASTPLPGLPNFQPAATETLEPAATFSESPPRSLDSRQALFGVFLI